MTTDVLMYQTQDDGEIAPDLALTKTPETAVYLALFGGNEEDRSLRNDNLQWWGNELWSDTDRHYRSLTQHVLDQSPINTALFKRLKDAIKRDLKNIADDLEIILTIPKRNHIHIVIIASEFTVEYDHEN